MSTDKATKNHEPGPLLGLGLSEGLAMPRAGVKVKRIYAHPCAACGKHDFAFHEEHHTCTEYKWVCGACGIQMRISFTEGGAAALQTPTGRRCERTLALFRIRSAPHIMFVYEGCAWDGSLDHDYYYHEGTCPTNLMRCEEIIASGKQDPHGIFELVAEHCITGPTARNREDVLNELVELATQQTGMANVRVKPDTTE